MSDATHLIIGGDSTIGQAVAMRLTGQVLLTSRRAVSDLHLDLADNPDDWPIPPGVTTALFCAAATRLADCRNAPDQTQRINADHPARLAHRLADAGCRVLLLSTNHVFPGTQPRPSTDTPTAPRSVYGQQKALAESCFPDTTTIIRLTKVLPRHAPPLQGWVDSLQRNEPITAFHDMVFAPITLEHAANAITQAIEQATTNRIIQLSANSDITYEDAARWIAHRLGIDPHLIQTASFRDKGIPDEEAPSYSAMACDNAPSPQDAIVWSLGI